jgi:hypothetical protein
MKLHIKGFLESGFGKLGEAATIDTNNYPGAW